MGSNGTVTELQRNSTNWTVVVDEIVKMEKKIFPKHESLARSFDEELKKKNSGLLYIPIHGQVVGYVMYAWPTSLSASITKLAVKESYRGQGHGEVLRNQWKIQLQFQRRGHRDNFTSHLYSALSQKGIDNDLKRGDEISQSLVDAIEASSISIIIFSESYASSSWCLDELLRILECKTNYGQIVIPVFYRVDPSHVRKQSGNFGDSFSKLEEQFPDRMQTWRIALTEAANPSGFDSHVVRLDDTFQSESKDPVGVESRIKEIEALLGTGSTDVYKLGIWIWGIGGIGKTTIAGAIFNKISRHFEGSYFAHNVRDADQTGRLPHLRQELLSALLGGENVKNIPNTGLNFQSKRLTRRKVLIVFDDVNHLRQIEFLIGHLDWFASGSRIIITTRDKRVLSSCWVNQIYQVKELGGVDALKLFSRFSFGRDHLDASYVEPTKKIVKYAQGVPLVLWVSFYSKGEKRNGKVQ
ncbi:TMV resistance protein N [Citrus clementina]|nr:TMV resistance protein N [Citrus x clementina]